MFRSLAVLGVFTSSAFVRMFLTRRMQAQAALSKVPTRGTSMETEVVTLLKVPVKVLCFGGVTPSRIVRQPDRKPEELVLVVPGNPGLIEFYAAFAGRLYEKTQLPVWVVSHGGHEDLPSPSLSGHPHLYGLQGQLRQKQELIDSYLQGVKLRCVGHSIGAKIVLDLLASGPPYAAQVQTAHLLFPTVERMATTHNGQKIVFLLRYLYWPIMLLLAILNTLPTALKALLVRVFLWISGDPPTTLGAFMRFLDARVVRKVMFLADEEMRTVLARDDETIGRYESRLSFFYSALDDWTPPDYLQDLKTRFPGIDARMDQTGIVHSFTLKYSVPVADILAKDILDKGKSLSDAKN